MGNSQKFNPFICSELQDSLNRLSSVYSEYLQTVFSPEVLTAQIQQLQEEIVKPYKQFLQSYTPAMFSSLADSLSQMSEAITASVRDNITAGMYNSLNESLKAIISLQDFQQQLADSAPESNCPDNFSDLSEDDFVIADESVIKTYELPDSVYIPLGNHRIKIPTSTFVAIIGIILSAMVSISLSIIQSKSSQATQTKQMQIEEAQLQLQRSQNELLQQLLHNVDVSSSSEAESIKELKEAVEEQNKQFSQIQDTTVSTAKDLDSSEEAEDTDSSK